MPEDGKKLGLYEKEMYEAYVQKLLDEEIFFRAEGYVERIFCSQVSWYDDGTWQLQPGIWRDYPDCIYAGISDPNEIKEGEDYRVEDCTYDSGHFRRIPLFLKSYQYAFCGNDNILDAYRATASKFPLDAEGQETYTDPTTIREQNPIFLSEQYRQFLCYLAGRLK